VMSTPLRLCPGRPHRVKHSAMSGNGETPWRRSSVASADHPLKPLLPASCWKLSVADNGLGEPDGVFAQPKTGLGTGIVKALAQQLGATVETSASSEGTTVSITHATFSTRATRTT
jgi:two-component sensor histidine kinase